MGIQFNKDPLVLEYNNCATKIVNCYIVNELDTSPNIFLNNFELKICFFGFTNIEKTSDKAKLVYSSYGIGFDGDRFVDFWYNFDKKKMFFDIDNSSSSHSENQKNNFLVLCKGSTYDVNEGFASAERSLILILLRQTQNVA